MAQALLFRSIVLLTLLFTGLGFTSAEAQTGWSVCNETSYVIQVAGGRPEGGGTVVLSLIHI